MLIPKVVIVRTSKGQKYADFILKEINLAGFLGGITDIENLEKYLKDKKCLPNSTIIHPRTAHPGYIYRVLKKLEQEGYKVINSSEVIKLTSDKFGSCVFAREKEIPCAETFKINKKQASNFIKEKVSEWGKVIAKPRASQGQGEFCFKFNNANINQIEKINKIPGQDLVIQKFIDYQRLSRIIVIGFKALEKAVFYDEPRDGWKCSVCLNQEIKHYKNPPKELLKFAENVAQKFKAEISFIDIFTTEKGYILNEINTACNLTIHERISKYNISKDIADYLLKIHVF